MPQQPMTTDVAALAERLDDFNARLDKIANGLPITSATTAVALLTSLNAGLFREVAAALRQHLERRSHDL